MSEFFTSVYLRSDYHCIKCSPETRLKNAFTTIFGNYKFLRMSFGLAWGPTHCAALMKKVLGTFHDFYMDNVLMYDSNEEDHFEHLKIMFLQIRKAGLKLNLS